MAFLSRISLILSERQDKDREIKELIGENSSWNQYLHNQMQEEQSRMTTSLGRTMSFGGSEDGFGAA
jgi:hypothetical protein